VLVTTRGQDTRARMLLRRCFGGSAYVITASIPLGNWPYEIAYQWGALVKALIVDRTCLPASIGCRVREQRAEPVPLRHDGHGVAASRKRK
jgi:hypothetical protein